MKTPRLEVVVKQDFMKAKESTHDAFSKIAVLRLIKNDKEETVSLKKYLYLSEVISYEDGTPSADFEWEGPTTFIVCAFEMFYISGSVDDFNKEMEKYISSVRKLMDNSSE